MKDKVKEISRQFFKGLIDEAQYAAKIQDLAHSTDQANQLREIIDALLEPAP